jgi:hypothetical protein
LASQKKMMDHLAHLQYQVYHLGCMMNTK